MFLYGCQFGLYFVDYRNTAKIHIKHDDNYSYKIKSD